VLVLPLCEKSKQSFDDSRLESSLRRSLALDLPGSFDFDEAVSVHIGQPRKGPMEDKSSGIRSIDSLVSLHSLD
jgi:hypothetical protein